MIRTIHKFPLDQILLQGEQVLQLPENGTILKLDTQYGVPTLWVERKPDSNTVPVRFKLVTTGSKFEATGLNYIGTFQLDGGGFVGHVYEVNQ